MAAFYLIATLTVLQGLLVSYCETTAMGHTNVTCTTSTANVTCSMSPANVTCTMSPANATCTMSTANVTCTMSPANATCTMGTANVIGNNPLPTTVQATPSLGGNETTAMGGGTVTGTATVTTVMGGGGGTSVTTAIGGGGTATVTTAMGGGGDGTATTAAGVGGGGATATTASQGAGGGATVTATAGGGVGGANSTAVVVGNVTKAMSAGGGGATVTTVAGGGLISSSTTTTTITPSIAPEKEPGPTVILILRVTTTCSADNLLAFNVSVQNDIKTVYTSEGFPIKSVITQSIGCNSPINITLELSFDSEIPSGKTIKGVFKAALKEGKIRNLTESNTIYTVTFTGVTFMYNPKDGQCQAICCGAGGALTVERVCTPEDKCKGIEPDEKEEEGHCPKEEKGTCPDTCGDDGTHNSPSYALVTLLAIAIFTKTMFF